MSCNLRRLREDDLEQVMHWRMRPDITQNMYSTPQLTLVQQRNWFERISQSDRDRYWIIEAGEAKQSIGVINLTDIDLVHRRCAWAYYIAETAARGRGIAKTIECNINDYVFEMMNFNRLWCEVLAFNDRVVKLHELFGARTEGVLRQHVMKDGKFHDVVRMAVLRNDWLALRPSIRYSKIEIE